MGSVYLITWYLAFYNCFTVSAYITNNEEFNKHLHISSRNFSRNNECEEANNRKTIIIINFPQDNFLSIRYVLRMICNEHMAEDDIR